MFGKQVCVYYSASSVACCQFIHVRCVLFYETFMRFFNVCHVGMISFVIIEWPSGKTG